MSRCPYVQFKAINKSIIRIVFFQNLRIAAIINSKYKNRLTGKG